MALGLAADDVSATPPADVGIARVLVHGLVPGLLGQKPLLDVLLVTLMTSLVVSPRLRRKPYKLVYVISSSWQTSSTHSKLRKLFYTCTRLHLLLYQLSKLHQAQRLLRPQCRQEPTHSPHMRAFGCR